MTQPELQTRFDQAIELMPHPVLMTDAPPGHVEPQVVYANAAAERAAGRARGQLLGPIGQARLWCGFTGPTAEAFARARGTGAVEGPVNGTLAAGRPWALRALRDDDERITGFLVVYPDGIDEGTTEQLHRLEVLLHLNEELSEAGYDLAHEWQWAADLTRAITGADGAALLDHRGGRLVFRAAAGSAASAAGMELENGKALENLAEHRRETAIVADARLDGRPLFQVQREALELRSALLVPLFRHQRWYGALEAIGRTPEQFDKLDLVLLTKAAALIVPRLATATHHEREARRRRCLVDGLPVPTAYLGPDRCYREVNAPFEQWHGRHASELIGHPERRVIGDEAYAVLRPHHDAAQRGERSHFEGEVTFPDGGRRYVHADYLPDVCEDGKVLGYYVLLRDLTRAREADLDYLTGLPNRRRFEERLEELVATTHRYDRPLSLIMVDLDRFKRINDVHGHHRGDDALRYAAHTLGTSVREMDVVARWGGEEFVVAAPETPLEEATRLAARLRQELRAGDAAGLGTLTGSFGVTAIAPADDSASLQRRADFALYRAKRDGGDLVAVEASP